jgi:hypothetical protein
VPTPLLYLDSTSSTDANVVVGLLFVVALWVAFVVLAVKMAETRHRDKGTWGVLAFFFGIFAIISLALIGKADGNVKTCPQCAETVQTGARLCKHCRYQFMPDVIHGGAA